MRLRRWMDHPAVALVITGGVLAILVTLALLQYRWIGQVTEAERERLQAGLDSATVRFAADFNWEFARLAQTMTPGGPRFGPQAPEDYAERFVRWLEAAPFPGVIRDLYLARGSELLQFQRDGADFVPIAWPPRLTPLQARLESRSRGPGPGFSIEDDVPALVAPVVRGRPPRWRGEPPPRPEPEGWLIAELDLGYLRSQYLPELASRHFSPDYVVEIIRRADPRHPVYRSHPGGDTSDRVPDASAPLLEWRPGGPGLGFGRPGPPPGPGRFRRRIEGQGPWEVQVRHQSGSLETMVERVRLRNLSLSAAVLLVLGVSLILLVASSRRAQRLARLEIEFAAGVSHELRTPLAVIRSAGENLADGVVADDAQLKRYGSLIRDEARRLSEMVDQILSFAGLAAGRRSYDLQPVAVAHVLERAIEACRPELAASGRRVEAEIAPDVPPVLADATSLAHALRNLITNALKHAGGVEPIRVRASRAGSGGEVELTVEDHGPGIDPADLPYVFDAFYRGRRAVADQTRGTGLGLTLVKRIVEAHGGRVEASNGPNGGARFTMRLPAKPV